MFSPIEWLPSELHAESWHAPLQVVGLIGSFTYVCVFSLIQAGRVCGNGILYPILQVFAASCVLASLTTAFNLAAVIIQFSFILIALYGIWYRVSGRLSARLDRSRAVAQPTQAIAIAHRQGSTGTDAQSSAPEILRFSPSNMQAAPGVPSHSATMDRSEQGKFGWQSL